MKVSILFLIRKCILIVLNWRWSHQASGRLIKVKYTGNSLGGSETGGSQQVLI